MGESGEKAVSLCPLIAFDRQAACQGKPVTPRILSRELKEPEKLGFIHRKQYPVVPPKVEYSLTERGGRLIPIIQQVLRWGMTGAHEAPLRATKAPARPAVPV